MIIIALVYLAGYLLSFAMIRTEDEAEQRPYTKGARVATYAFSMLSWLMVIVTLISAWAEKIKATGYWNRPVMPIEKTEKQPSGK